MTNKTTLKRLKLDPYFSKTIDTNLNVWSHDQNSYEIKFEFYDHQCDKPIDLTGADMRILLDHAGSQPKIYPLEIESKVLGLAKFIMPEQIRGCEGKFTAHIYADYPNRTHDFGSFTFYTQLSKIDKSVDGCLDTVYVSEFEKALEKFKEIEQKIEQNDLVTKPYLRSYAYDKNYVQAEFNSLEKTKVDISTFNYEMNNKANTGYVDSELAKKSDKYYVESEIKRLDNTTRKTNAPITTGDLSQELKESMTGGSVAVVGINSVDNINVKNKAISPLKTTFLTQGKNLLDPDMIVLNYYWLNDAREPYPNEVYCYIKIDLKKDESISFHDATGKRVNMRYVTAFNSKGELQSSLGAQYTSIYTAKENTDYVVVSFEKRFLNDRIILFYGTGTTNYEKFKVKPKNYVGLSDLMKSEIKDDVINSFYIQNALFEDVNVIDTLEKQANSYISGWKQVGSYKKPDLLKSETNDVYKFVYPKVRKGKVRIRFDKLSIGQQVFISDVHDNYIKMSNMNNFPNFERDGWRVDNSNNYFEIDMENVASNEGVVYFTTVKGKDNYAVVSGKQRLKSMMFDEDEQAFEILLPEKYPVVENEEAYIYFEQALHSQSVNSCYLNVNAWANKENRNTGYTLIKTATDEIRELNFEKGNDKIKDSTQIKVVPKMAGNGKTFKVMVIGESTTDTDKSLDYIPELKQRFVGDPLSINLVGSRGKEGFKHEGRSGWGVAALRCLQSRNGVENDFYDRDKHEFNFAKYLEKNPEASDTDVFIIRFGINDPNRFTNSQLSFIEHYDFIMNDIRKSIPEAVFVIEVTMSLARTMPAVTHGSRKEIMERNKQILDYYQRREDEGIFVSSAYLNVDPINDYPKEKVKINKYSSETTDFVTDVTHPAKSGQQKQADITYFMLKYIADVRS